MHVCIIFVSLQQQLSSSCCIDIVVLGAMSGDTYYKVWCCMKDTPCPKVSQHIGIAADFEAATNMAINHLMTSTYHKMDEDEANLKIPEFNIEQKDWQDDWGPKEPYFEKKKWDKDEQDASSWGRDEDWNGQAWDDQAGPYGKGKGKGSKGKGKKDKGGKGGKGGGNRGGGQEVTQSLVELVQGITSAVANQNQQGPQAPMLQLPTDPYQNNSLAVRQGGVATRSGINMIIENISRCYICYSLEASFSC